MMSVDSYSGSGEEIHEMLDAFPVTPEPATPTSPMKSTVSPKSPLKGSGGKRLARSTSVNKNKQGNVVHSGSRTIYTAGRPPWYNTHGQLEQAFVIGELNRMLMADSALAGSS